METKPPHKPDTITEIADSFLGPSSQTFVQGIEQIVKVKILPVAIASLMNELEKKNIWTPTHRAEGRAQLLETSTKVIDYELDRMDLYMKGNVFRHKLVKDFRHTSIEKRNSVKSDILRMKQKAERIATLEAEEVADTLQDEIQKQLEIRKVAEMGPGDIHNKLVALKETKAYLAHNKALLKSLIHSLNKRASKTRTLIQTKEEWL